MVIKNKIFSSGQVVTIATGQDYTLKDDEVYINNHTYKKRDLEIKLDTPTELREQSQVKIGVRLRGGMKSLPADFGLYNEWEVDNTVPTSLADAIELITTCIYTSSDTSLLAAILAEVTAINGNTDELEDVVRKDIELVPASELSPDGSRRFLQVEYAVTLDGTKTLVGVTELDGSAVTDGSVPVFASSSSVVKTEIVICVNEKIIHVNDFEDNTTGDFDSVLTFTNAYPPNGIRLELVDGETALDGTFDNLTAKFKHEVSFQLFFGGVTTNQLVVEVQDAADNSVLETLTVVENPANDGTYKIEFTAPDSEEIILRLNTSAMDSTSWIDDVVIKRLQTGASLAKRFDEASNELTADRKFFLSGVLIPAIPADEFSEGSCQVDLSDVIAQLEDMIPETGRVNISDHADISGQKGTITDPSSFSFVWGNNAAGTFTLTNTVTGQVTTYSALSGVAPSNAVDEGRFILEEHTFDASGASDLWLNIQGARIEYVPLTPFCGSLNPLPTFTGLLPIELQELGVTGFSIVNEGTKLYLAGTQSDSVNEYTLSTPYDITTAVFQNSFFVGNSSPTGLECLDDGTKIYVANAGGGDLQIREITLSTPYDVTTASITHIVDISANTATPRGIYITPDGTQIFVANNFSSTISEYALSTPYDLSTISFVINHSGFSTSFASSLHIDNEGTILYLMTESKEIGIYDLSTPYDLSTISFVESVDISSISDLPKDIVLSNNGTIMYTADNGDDMIFQFALNCDN